MKQDTTTEPRATIYLAGLVVLVAIAQSQAANAWFLAFGLLPMCFHVTTARRAVAFVVIINVIAAGLDVWRDPRAAAGPDQRRDRPGPVHQRGHREDAPAARVRQMKGGGEVGGVSGRTAAVITAIERGLLPPPGGNR
jgi:hypothetical protein